MGQEDMQSMRKSVQTVEAGMKRLGGRPGAPFWLDFGPKRLRIDPKRLSKAISKATRAAHRAPPAVEEVGGLQ